MTSMRAKARISGITAYPSLDAPTQETLHFHGVAKDSSYPPDGSDEDNTYAKYSPSFSIDLTVANPVLIGKFKMGDTFYVDFTPVPAKGE